MKSADGARRTDPCGPLFLAGRPVIRMKIIGKPHACLFAFPSHTAIWRARLQPQLPSKPAPCCTGRRPMLSLPVSQHGLKYSGRTSLVVQFVTFSVHGEVLDELVGAFHDT